MINILDYSDWINDALEYNGGTHDLSDIIQGVLSGEMQIWPAPNGVAITQILRYPRKQVLHVLLAAGEMDQLTDMLDAASDWGRAQKCTSMTMAGRHGWARVLPKHGWKQTMIAMEKEI